MTYRGEKKHFWLRIFKDTILSAGILVFVAGIIFGISSWAIFVDHNFQQKVIILFFSLIFSFFLLIISLGVYILLKNLIERKQQSR